MSLNTLLLTVLTKDNVSSTHWKNAAGGPKHSPQCLSILGTFSFQRCIALREVENLHNPTTTDSFVAPSVQLCHIAIIPGKLKLP